MIQIDEHIFSNGLVKNHQLAHIGALSQDWLANHLPGKKEWQLDGSNKLLGCPRNLVNG